MKRTMFSLLIILYSYTCLGQNNLEQAKKDFAEAKKCYEYIKYDSATALYEKASDIYKRNKKNEEFFNCQIGIGQCYVKKNDFQKACSWFKDLQSKAEKQFGPNKAVSATCIYYQGFANLYLWKLDEAESLINKSLELRLKLFGQNHADVAQSYNLLGQYFLVKGDYENSLKNFDKALKIREKIYGKEHQDVAQSLNNVSSVYYYQGYLDTAIELASKSLKIKEKVLPKDHPDFISSYNSLAIYLNEQMKFKDALDLHLKNLVLCEQYYGHQNPTTSLIYNNIGVCYLKLKDYKPALDYLNESVKIRKSLSKSDNQDIAGTWLTIGDVYDETYQYDKSVKIKKEALEIFTKTLGEDHPNTAMAHNSLGISLKNSGDFSHSIEHFEKALSSFNKTQGDVNPNSAMCMVNIGANYAEKGQNEQALAYYQRALPMYEGFYGESSYELTILYHNIGELYNTMGEYSTALVYLNKSLKTKESLFGGPNEKIALDYINIGNNYEYTGNYDAALKKYNDALEICKQTIGEKHLTTATVYENISKIYFSKNDYKGAKDFAEKAFEIRRELLPRKHYLVSYSLNDMGQAAYKLGNHMEALDHYTFSLQNNLRDYTPAGINYYKIPEIKNFQDIFSILTAFKGKVLVFIDLYLDEKKSQDERKENAQHALDHIKTCDQVIDIIRKTNLNEKDKLSLSSNSTAVYDLAVHFCNLLYLDTKDQKYLELAFYYSEKLKAGTLLEALAGADAQKFANIPDSIIICEKQLDRSIADIQKQLVENHSDDLDDLLFNLEREKQNLISYCETNYPKYYQLKYSENLPDIKTIQASLENNVALVSYYQTEKTIYQIVLTKKKIAISQSVKLEYFDQQVEDLRHAIIFGNSKENMENYKRLAYEFCQMLFPIKFDKEINHLIIIPSGNLATIPFEALLINKPSEKQKFKDLSYLINKYTISYAYSANLYYLTSQKQKLEDIEVTQLNDWLAFAPVFSDESTAGISMRSRGLLRQISAGIDTLKTRGTLLNGNYVSPLPGTENEVKTIFDVFDKSNKKAVVKINQSANESFVKSDELKKYKYIHFATHGFVDSEKPELSGILLAQDTTGGNDGILFSGEIYNLELNASLVALSACETGLGKIQSGEGIIGLTRALLYAGAKNIIVSLWQVSDEATSQLMIEFYSGLLKTNNQQTFSEYLRNAKLKLIKEGKFLHPFFWSPFILIGK